MRREKIKLQPRQAPQPHVRAKEMARTNNQPSKLDLINQLTQS